MASRDVPLFRPWSEPNHAQDTIKIAPETHRFLDLFVRVGNWIPGVENPDPLHRVRISMRNNHILQHQNKLADFDDEDPTKAKLIRLVRLLARQEALDFINRTGTIETEVQP